MKRLKIINDHEWTLRKQERKIKHPLLRQRGMAVHLVMENYLSKEAKSTIVIVSWFWCWITSVFTMPK